MSLCAKCGASVNAHRFKCPDHPLNITGKNAMGTHGAVGPERADEVRLLRKQIDSLAQANQELQDELVKWKAAAREREAIIVQSEKLIEQFLPNAARCFGVDAQLLNETLIAMRQPK